MDIGKAFAFVFEDEGWIKKILIGVLLLLSMIFVIPIFVVPFIFVGYSVQVARNVRDGLPNPLPEWENFGDFLSDGFAVGAAQFIYGLPIFLLGGFGGFTAAAGDASGSDGLMALGGTVFAVLGCLSLLWMLALIAIGPAIYIQYLKHGTFSSCMDFSEVLRLTREHLSEILVAVLVIFAGNLIVGVAGFIPCIGIFIGLGSVPYMTMFRGHVFGQLAADILGGAGGKGDKFDDIIMPDDMI